MIHTWYQRIERHQIDVHEPHIRHQRMERAPNYLVSTVGMMVTAWVGMIRSSFFFYLWSNNNNIAPTIMNQGKKYVSDGE